MERPGKKDGPKGPDFRGLVGTNTPFNQAQNLQRTFQLAQLKARLEAAQRIVHVDLLAFSILPETLQDGFALSCFWLKIQIT